MQSYMYNYIYDYVYNYMAKASSRGTLEDYRGTSLIRKRPPPRITVGP